MQFFRSCIVSAITLAAVLTAQAEDLSTKEIVDNAKDAVIQIEIVWSIKVTYKGNEAPPQEKKMKVNGTVITEDGLTILSSSRVTPQVRGGSQASIQADPQSVTFLLDDGTEIEGEIALKDNDLDIMYVKPVDEPKSKFAHVKLQKGVAPAVLDEIVSLNRLSTQTDRAVLYLESDVIGIITKPRTYFVTTQAVPGMPAFTKDGKCFGLYLESKALNRMAILPAEDILDSASQLEE